MNRRSFFGTLAAAIAAPLLPTPQPALTDVFQPSRAQEAFLTSISINGKVIATFDPPKRLCPGETLRIGQEAPTPPFRWHSYEVAMRER